MLGHGRVVFDTRSPRQNLREVTLAAGGAAYGLCTGNVVDGAALAEPGGDVAAHLGGPVLAELVLRAHAQDGEAGQGKPPRWLLVERVARYRRLVATLGLVAGKEPRQGKYLGLPDKFLLVLFQKKSDLARYVDRFCGMQADKSQRGYHLVDAALHTQLGVRPQHDTLKPSSRHRNTFI